MYNTYTTLHSHAEHAFTECKGKPVAEVRFIPVKDDQETLEDALYRADESGVTGENPPTK